MNFISYAQNYEDVMLWRSLKHIEHGFYVDVGANDPVQDSLTKAFYDRGWSGINIEPVTEWYKKLSAERQRDVNLQVAAGNSDGELHLFEVVGTGLSTASEDYAKRHAQDQGFEVHQQVVSAQTLTSILRKYSVSEIHFLKIDVEGSEKSVLEGLDLEAIRPWIILVEATKPQTQILDYHHWEHLIVEKKYQFVYFDGLNRFYVANEHADLADTFDSPPNPWDRYERSTEHTLRQQYQALEKQYQTLEMTHEMLTKEHSTIEAEAADLRGQLSLQSADNQALEEALQKLLNSRSMKITAPLRKLSSMKEDLKGWPKRLSRKAIFTVVSQPRLRRLVKPIADQYPTLQYRLSRFLHGNSKSSPVALNPLSDTDLSSRSARILEDLRRASQ